MISLVEDGEGLDDLAMWGGFCRGGGDFLKSPVSTAL